MIISVYDISVTGQNNLAAEKVKKISANNYHSRLHRFFVPESILRSLPFGEISRKNPCIRGLSGSVG